MKGSFRNILAVFAGIVAGGLVVALVEGVGHMLFPLAGGIDPSNPDSLKTMMSRIPVGALAFVVLAWAQGAFTGAWVAARVAADRPLTQGMLVGGVQLAAGVATMLSIPHPPWMWVLGVVLPLPAAYLGVQAAARKRAASA